MIEELTKELASLEDRVDDEFSLIKEDKDSLEVLVTSVLVMILLLEITEEDIDVEEAIVVAKLPSPCQ
jgi:hypothetical protein